MSPVTELWQRRAEFGTDAVALAAGAAFLGCLVLAGGSNLLAILMWLALLLLRVFSPTVALTLVGVAPLVWWWSVPESTWWAVPAAITLIVQLAATALQSAGPRAALPNRARLLRSVRQALTLSLLPVVVAATAALLGHRSPSMLWTAVGLLIVLALAVVAIMAGRATSEVEETSAREVATSSE